MVLTLSSEGKVTIPPEERERLGLHPGDELDVAVRRLSPSRLAPPEVRARLLEELQRSAKERLRGHPWEHMTSQEIIDDMRGRNDEGV
jgi:AbrB family looped-hinge helix DNA binding protein